MELPGVSNVQEVRKLLQGTALLEFKLVIDPQISVKVMEKINTYLAGGNLDSLVKADSLSKITRLDSLKKDTTKNTKSDIKKDSTSITNKKDSTKKDISKKDTSKKNTSKKDSVKEGDSNITGLTDSNGNPIDTNQQLSEEEFKHKNPWFYLVRPQQFKDGSVAWFVRETASESSKA